MTLPSLHDVEALDRDAAATLFRQVADLHAALVLRLTAPPPAPAPIEPEPDDVVDLDEARKITRRSESWMRKHGHTLPGFVQPGGKRTRPGWLRRRLTAWASGTAP